MKLAPRELDKLLIFTAARVARAKVWKSFDFQIFNYCLEAAQRNEVEALLKLDEICYASKIAEENRMAMIKVGANLLSAMDFERGCLGASYKELVQQGKAHGTYPLSWQSFRRR